MRATDRRRYQSRTQQFLTFAAVIASKNGIFTLPRLLFIHGGAPFVIAYTTLTVSVVIPVMQLESVLGQFTGAGNIGIFDTVPGMRGLGHTMTFYFTLGMTMFVTECSYSTVFLASLFRSTLPWADCSHYRPSDSCYELQRKMALCSSVQEHLVQRYRHSHETQGMPVTNGTTTVLVPESAYNFNDCVNGTQSATHLFFDSKVLRLSTDGRDVIHPEIAIAMAGLWLLVFAATRNGLQNAEYAVYVIASLTITTLTLMLVNSLALKCSDRGINLLVRAPLSGVVSYELWRDALKVAISNIGIFSGGFLSTARFNIFKTKIGTFSTVVALMQLISSLLYGLLFYAHVGFLSSVKDTDIERILQTADIEHVIMPETLTILDTTRVWCTVYFTWLLANAVGYMMIGPEVVLEAIVFEFPGFAKFQNELRLTACLCFYVLGLCLTTTSGPYIIKLLVPNIEVIAALSLLLEVLVIVRIYGIHRVMMDYQTMTGNYPNLMMRLSWTYGVPLQLTVLLAIEAMEPSPEGYRGVRFSYFAKLFGIWIIVVAVSFIPTYLFALLTVHPWEKIMAPAMTWLPDDKAATREYRALMRECDYASRKGALPDQPSLATSGQISVAGGASRGDTVTVAETIDPREMAGAMERSVSFAPDVITTPRYSENFNELLERQFGLRSSRSSSRDATSQASFLDDASSTIQIKVPGYERNIDTVPASVFAKEDVEEIRKIIDNVDTALCTLCPEDAAFAEKIAMGNGESAKRAAESSLASKREADRGGSYDAAAALALPPREGDAKLAKDAVTKSDRKQSAAPLRPAAPLHQLEFDVKPASTAGTAGKIDSRQGLVPSPEPAPLVGQPTEGGVRTPVEQAAHSGIESQSPSGKHAQHLMSKERSGPKRKKNKRSSLSRSQKKRGSKQLSKKSASRKRKSLGPESADVNQGKDSVECCPKDSAKGSTMASPSKIGSKESLTP
ncbi:sodium-dependent proline transporter-like [Dermacentor andersoni]|uniref:sodium-dependent proline transporter-like n=1 Tax=Dermacentor andersoni TaxID=34620 RepID=UPI002416CCB3|nr:sodium- and chloride-dependent glycine transporter 2-like [Dermacentor andersoni]